MSGRTEVRHVPMVVVDQSATEESRALATLLANTQNFDVASRAPGLKEAEAELASGRVKAALVVPPLNSPPPRI